MKDKTTYDKNTRPVLDKLEKDYTKHPKGNLADGLGQLADAKFSTDELEYVFQLLEAELRETDSQTVLEVLKNFKTENSDRWNLLVSHTTKIVDGTIKSASSHQLIALIELVAENKAS